MHDIKNSRGIPVSTGIPPVVKYAALVGLIMIFGMIACVLVASPFGHVWPSIDSTKIKL